MTQTPKVYKNNQVEQHVITTVSSNCKSPKLKVRFCNILKPFYYPRSPKVPRYSITCLLDENKDSDFIADVRSIEKNEGVESIIKKDQQKNNGVYEETPYRIIKFQSKEKIPVYMLQNDKFEEITLEDELAKDELVEVIFDIRRYTNKTACRTNHGLNFKPVGVIYYPKEA